MVYKNYTKRLFDLLLAIILLAFAWPFVLCILFVLMFYNKGRPFFFQQRAGMYGKIFKVVKFKTMIDAYGEDGKLLPDHLRTTWFGNWLRKLSLDELPQIFNILKGDMSLIGPRPLLVRYLEFYDEFQKRRHEVRPGITGWAQINGRNTISWEDRFELDVWYVDNLSMLLDVKIFFMTIIKIVKREGINADGQVTMKPFTGSHKNN